MHVDIDQFRWHLQIQVADAIPPHHQQTMHAILQSMAQRAIPNASTIDEEVLQSIVATMDAGISDVTFKFDRALLRFDGDELIADFLTEEPGDTLSQRTV